MSVSDAPHPQSGGASPDAAQAPGDPLPGRRILIVEDDPYITLALEDTLTRSAEDIAATVTNRLRAVGVDTDRMADVAREQASELQTLIEDEIRERPLRALGLAAAIGLFVGYLSAR